MNGPLQMYRMRQIIKHNNNTAAIQVPNCMYRMRKILIANNNNDSSTSTAGTLNTIHEQNYNSEKMTKLEQRQHNILKQLAELKEQMLDIRSSLNVPNNNNNDDDGATKMDHHSFLTAKIRNNNNLDLVLNVNPSNPPYSLLFLKKFWPNSLQLLIESYLHSSISELPDIALDFLKQLNQNQQSHVKNGEQQQVLIRLIWKNVDEGVQLITSSPLSISIHGEVNVLRYLSRISGNGYDLWPNAMEMDSVLDICFLLSRSRTKSDRHAYMQLLNAYLGKSKWLCNNQNEHHTFVDYVAYSILKQVALPNDINVNLTKWLQRCQLLLILSLS